MENFKFFSIVVACLGFWGLAVDLATMRETRHQAKIFCECHGGVKSMIFLTGHDFRRVRCNDGVTKMLFVWERLPKCKRAESDTGTKNH